MNRFPLKLAPFEEFFLHKHRPDYPATFFAYFEFSQPLNRQLAETAFKATCRQHPFARATVQQRSNGYWWQESSQPVIQWCDRPVSLQNVPDSSLEIAREPGIKVWAFDGQGTGNQFACMQFVIHHVALDGLGFLQFYGDWLRAYQRLQSVSSDLPKELDVAELSIPARCRSTMGFREALRLLPGQWKSIRATFQILHRVAIPLAPWKPPVEMAPRRPSVTRLYFSQEETKELKELAANQRVTLNSILLRDLFVAINQWQSSLPTVPEGTHVRLMVPINERRREHRKAAACNHCTLINLDRTRDEISDSSALLASIEQEMGVIQRWKLSLNFWRALSLFRWLPGGLKRFQSNDVSATALVTNVGRLKPGLTASSAGADTVLKTTDIDFVAPLMFGTVGAFTIAYLHGKLKITLHYDSEFVTFDQIRQLTTLVRDRLLCHA